MRSASTAFAAEGYEAPNYRAPLSVERVKAAAPANATAKGFYMRAFTKELAQYGHHLEGFGPYRDFSDYSVSESISLLVECAKRMYANDPLREGLRRLGWVVFPTLLSTMIGRVVFGALGNDVPAVARHAHRGFEVSLSVGRCEALRVSERECELRVRDFYIFPDCFLVGVFEGALAHYGHDVDVRLRQISDHAYEYRLAW